MILAGHPQAQNNPGLKLGLKKSHYGQIKNNLRSRFTPNQIITLHEYDALPMLHLRASNPQVLLQLLQDSKIRRLYEIENLEPFLAESLPLIGQDLAINLGSGFTGAGTTVAVLDTGADYTHAAFGSCTGVATPASCRVVYSQDFAPNDGELDDNGHGTNVSGIVAGVAPEVEIAALDVFDGAVAPTDSIIAAINWVINNQATYNIVSMNLSLGIPYPHFNTPCMDNWAAIPFANAREAGVLPVVASGNEASTNGIAAPACTPGAVSVGAVYDSYTEVGWFVPLCFDAEEEADQVTCFSNSSPFLSLLAPGAYIEAAGITAAGTSQAAPHVAGTVALMKDANPELSPSDSEALLINTGVDVLDDRNGLTFPRLNALAAVFGAAAWGSLDSDGDGVINEFDNCPFDASGSHADPDGDDQGNVCDLDDDGDFLLDTDEVIYGSDPFNPDSDGDGVLDGLEVIAGRNPTVHEPAILIAVTSHLH
ncbi:MAG: S8 family serine peptidase [Deltaproteobacteria bacterium]|nr:S8 family serine peptidase [Deltaproteobacteria bacterium]